MTCIGGRPPGLAESAARLGDASAILDDLRGAGTYDARTGEEELRLQVTLATGIPEDVCRSVNLGYLDPATIDIEVFAADAGAMVVPRAGEVRFRLHA
jgi:hypothetical protein